MDLEISQENQIARDIYLHIKSILNKKHFILFHFNSFNTIKQVIKIFRKRYLLTYKKYSE